MAELTLGTKMMIWLIAAALLVLASADSQDSVLTWTVYAYPTMSMHQFSIDKFTEFYKCLCTYAFDTCEVRLNDTWAVTISAESMLTDNVLGSNEFSSRYVCERRLPDYLFCERQKYTDDGCKGNYTKACWRFSLNNNRAVNCDTSFVEIIWEPGLEVTETFHDDTVYNSKLCEGGCNFSATLMSTTLVTSKTASSPKNAIAEDRDSGDNNFVIIGVVVGIVVLAALLTVIGVFLWRRRRNAAPGTTSSRNNKDLSTSDTPTSVAVPNIKNAQSSQIYTVPSASTGLFSYTNATVDPSKKTASVAILNANNGQPSQIAASTSTANEKSSYTYATVDPVKKTASVNFHNVKNGQPYQTATSPNTANGKFSYTYAAVDPSKKTQSKGAVQVTSTGDPGYYNQNYMASNTHPHSDDPNNRFNMAGNQNRDYCVVEKDQTSSRMTPNTTAPSFSNDIANNDESGHIYTETDDSNYYTDGTYNVINDNITDTDASNNLDIDPIENATAPTGDYEYVDPESKTNGSDYSRAKPDLSYTGNEYSRLHEATRQVQNPYNMLPGPEDDVNESPPISISISESLGSYSLAQPIDSKDTV